MPPRNYLLTILDDGEQHEYLVKGKDAYHVAINADVVALKYGHTLSQALELHVQQLVDEADMTGAFILR